MLLYWVCQHSFNVLNNSVVDQVIEDVTLPSSGQQWYLLFQFTDRPTLLLENYQPWLDLKIPSKVDASLSEVKHALI